MQHNRLTKEYRVGVDEFIALAKKNALARLDISSRKKKNVEVCIRIRCPCKCCKNLRTHSCGDVKDHLIINGMDTTYDTFVWHGEQAKIVTPDVAMGEAYRITMPDHGYAESSKQGERKGKKRRKQENAAIHAALHRNANSGIRISNSHANQLLSEKSKRMKVPFNKRGQPIENESNKLVSFLGATVREIVDINIDDWRKVSKELKNNLWTMTKKKESLDPSSITRSNVWVKGHTKKNGEPVNAEVAEKMKTIQDIKDTAAESSSSSLQDDAISQLFGPERPGHVRGVGFGVTPSQISILSESKEKVVQLERQVEELSRKVSSIESVREEMQDDIRQEMQEAIREEMHGAIREQMQQYILEKNEMATTQCSVQLQMHERGDVVAEGVWLSDHPDIVVLGKKLGSGASKIEVKFVNDPKAKLWRPSNGMKTFEDALGYSITWPTNHVIKE
ncbi:hypothetical protein IFM89_006732, partial [Coptis chinensis]